MNQKNNDVYPYCVTIESDNILDMDLAWEWCLEHLDKETYTFDVGTGPTLIVDYFFKKDEDAVRFQLTWG